MSDIFPPSSNSTTSAEAAASVVKSAKVLRQQVYDFIVANGGATDDEIINGLPMAHNTEHPRRWELVKQGLVAASEARRKTRAGKNAIVWVAT